MPTLPTRMAFAVAGSLVLAAAALPVSAAEPLAETTIDFAAEGYSLGASSPAGQNGWTASGPTLDWSLVDNDDRPAAGLPAGGRSLRLSNALVGGSPAPLTSPLIAPAGETVDSDVFDVTFDVASATGQLQPGLNVDVNLDGASRYGGVLNLRHTPEGLAIGSFWVDPAASGGPDDLGNWRSTVFTTVSATVPHTIRIRTQYLVDAPDVFEVWVDGSKVSGASGATTWEYYHRLNNTNTDATVDSLSFRPGRSAPSPDGLGYLPSQPAAPGTAGAGFLFSGISYRTVAATVPSAPTALTASPADQSIAAGWTAPDDGGASILGYDLQVNDGAGWVDAATSTTTSAIAEGLDNGTAYEMRARAENSVGTGAWSDPISATPRTVPDAPEITAAAPSSKTVGVAWSTPADGGAPIEGYLLQLRAAGGPWQDVVTTEAGTTQATVDGLTEGVAYEFRVRASNAAGDGPFGEAVGATPFRFAPDLRIGDGGALAGSTVAAGSTIVLTGERLPVGATVTATMHSAVVVTLGSARVDADGTFRLAVGIPADAEAGDHELVATLTDTGGDPVSVSVPFRVAATQGPGGALASTGAEIAPFFALAGLLLVVGAGVLVVVRRHARQGVR